jgi:hypothetical protein
MALGSRLPELVLPLGLQLEQGFRGDAIGYSLLAQNLLRVVEHRGHYLLGLNEIVVGHRKHKTFALGSLLEFFQGLEPLLELFGEPLHVQMLEVVVGHKSLDLLEELHADRVAQVIGLGLQDALHSVLLVLEDVRCNV